MSRTAILNRRQLTQSRHWVERVIAIALLLLSLLGTLTVFLGGWVPLLEGKITFYAIIGSIISQGALTWVEWAYGERRSNPIYLAALSIDTGLTTWGFGPLIVPRLTPWLEAHGTDGAGVYIAWLLLFILALLLAWYPESRLIGGSDD